jgi:hypothetical protein
MMEKEYLSPRLAHIKFNRISGLSTQAKGMTFGFFGIIGMERQSEFERKRK